MLNFKNISINSTKDLIYIYNIQKAVFLIKNGADFVSVGKNNMTNKFYMTFLKTSATERATKHYKEIFENPAISK